MIVKDGLYRCHSIEMHTMIINDERVIELHLIQASSMSRESYDELTCKASKLVEFNTGFIGSQVIMSMLDSGIMRLDLARNSGQQFKVGYDGQKWFIAIVHRA